MVYHIAADSACLSLFSLAPLFDGGGMVGIGIGVPLLHNAEANIVASDLTLM